MSGLYRLFDKYFVYLVLGVLVLIPLNPKLPLLNVVGTYVAIRLEDLVIAVVLGVWVIFNTKNFRLLYSQLIIKAILLFWLITFISLLSGIWVTHTVSPGLGFLHWLRRVEYMSLFVVSFTCLTSLKRIKLAVVVFLITSAIVAIYGFGQIWLNFPVISTNNSEFSKGQILFLSNNARVNSTFAGHYDLAIYLSMVLIISASLFFYYRELTLKVVVAINSVAAFILLGFTAARISFVAAVLGIAGVFWLLKRWWLLLGVGVVAVGLLVAIPDLRHRLVATLTVNILNGGGAKYSPSPDTYTIFTPINRIPANQRASVEDRLKREATASSGSSRTTPGDAVAGEPVNSTELGVYRSWGIRWNVEWPRALNSFYKNPILGTGYSSIALATDNDFLRSLGETGLLGSLALWLIFAIILRRLYFNVYHASGYLKYLSISSICLTMMVFLTGTFIDVLEASKVAEIFWLVLGLSWASVESKLVVNSK